jgi:DNA-binding transcriptional MerR regulator/effector-binding domain-containing protein
MLSIGAFAQLGQVTHRMLRHWDTAGLLVPAHVDEHSGYRSYDPSQLERLHRVVALRQLGFGLDDISLILDQGVDAARIEALLRIRRAEVEQEHRIAAARLVDVERRLHLIEREHQMSQIEIVEKPLPAVRLAALRVSVAEQPQVASVVGPTFDAVRAAFGGDTTALGLPIAQYDMTENGLDMVIGYEFAGDSGEGYEIVELPAVGLAMSGVHLGVMATIDLSWQGVFTETVARGLAPAGPCREVYLRDESDDQSDWVTELQLPVARA